jgi:hypothetical protein
MHEHGQDSKNITYIFHVFGTLTMDHVKLALESIHNQYPFRWKRFVLYNASNLPSADILARVPLHLFEKVEEHPKVRNDYKSCAADWLVQMREIGGTERYLCHKADFYLPPWTCQEFERLSRKGLDPDFILMFSKYDMKSRALPEDIRRYAMMPWRDGINQFDAGTYTEHLGKIGIPFEQTRGGMDGTMHGYSDGMRKLYKPTIDEITQRWGVAHWFRMLDVWYPGRVVRSHKFFACHMWHESPDRQDWNKNMSPDERF